MTIETSQTVAALSAALLQFQGMVEGVKRDSANPHFRNRYASLEAVMDAARPAMQACGLAWTQAPGRVVDGSIEVTTRLVHAESGEWQQFTMHVPLGKKDPQGAGSAVTYGCRYSLMAALGLPPTDDDAEAAIDRDNKRPKPKPQAPPRDDFPGDLPAMNNEAPPADEPPRRSSAALKRDNVWQSAMADLSHDLMDVRSVVSLNRLREDYRARAKAEGWNRVFMEQLKERFDQAEEDLERQEEPA